MEGFLGRQRHPFPPLHLCAPSVTDVTAFPGVFLPGDRTFMGLRGRLTFNSASSVLVLKTGQRTPASVHASLLHSPGVGGTGPDVGNGRPKPVLPEKAGAQGLVLCTPGHGAWGDQGRCAAGAPPSQASPLTRTPPNGGNPPQGDVEHRPQQGTLLHSPDRPPAGTPPGGALPLIAAPSLTQQL